MSIISSDSVSVSHTGRRHNHYLRDNAVDKATLGKYRTAVFSFLRYAVDSGASVWCIEELDELCVEYIEYLYCIKPSNKWKAEYLKCGLHHYYPHIKNKLVLFSRSLDGWRRMLPPKTRTPLTWEIVNVLAVTMVKSGYYAAGVATLLAFHCYLRIGEFTSLRVCDVALSGTRGKAVGGMCLSLKHTKTGDNQFVTVVDPIVVQLVTGLVIHHRNHSDNLVFGLSSVTYRAIFHDACNVNGLGGYDFVPHCLRHSGATHDHLLQVPMKDIIQRGRWRSAKSASTYIHSCKSLLARLNVPRLQLLGDVLGQNMLQHFQLYRIR